MSTPSVRPSVRPSLRRSSRLAAAASKRNLCIDVAPLTQAEIDAFVRPVQAALDHFNTLTDVGARYLQIMEFCPLIMQFPDQCAHYPAFRASILDMFSRAKVSLYCNEAMKHGLLTAWRQLYAFFLSLEALPTWRAPK